MALFAAANTPIMTPMHVACRRDFFPDIPKMKSQIEWMTAIRSGDESRIAQAQINIAARRAGLKTPSLSHTLRRDASSHIHPFCPSATSSRS